ncbi:MAG: hypothetical protein WAS28_00585, partial [Saprospiraceae bacterium]
MYRLNGLMLGLLMVICSSIFAQQGKPDRMKVFIDGLMAKMTLEEKLGQLNLPSAGDITTGSANSSD